MTHSQLQYAGSIVRTDLDALRDCLFGESGFVGDEVLAQTLGILVQDLQSLKEEALQLMVVLES